MPAIIHCMFCGTIVNSRPEEAMKLYGTVVHSMVYECIGCGTRYLRRSDPDYYAVLTKPNEARLQALKTQDE